MTFYYEERHRHSTREERQERIGTLRRILYGNRIAAQHFLAAQAYGRVALSDGVRSAIVDDMSREAAILAAYEMACGVAALALWRGH